MSPRATLKVYVLTLRHTHTKLKEGRRTTGKRAERHLPHGSAVPLRSRSDGRDLLFVQKLTGTRDSDKEEVASLRHGGQQLVVRADKVIHGTLVSASLGEGELLVQLAHGKNRLLELRDARAGVVLL